MKQILITGATGNIGTDVIRYLCKMEKESEIIAAIRNIDSTRNNFPDFSNLSFRRFDFEDRNTFKTAFQAIEVLFLLRPPHISQVEEYFKPLLEAAKEIGIEKIVFLSVQGAEKSRVIPHNKIERLIISLGFRYIFVRPSYFMQNLTTTLRSEIVENQSITLPSGKARFNWIDVKNIAEASAVLMKSFEKYQGNAYEITGTENVNFEGVTNLMTEIIGTPIRYKSINPVSFYFKKKKEGLPSGFAIVMTILHFLPRLQKEPEISDNYTKLTQKKPTILREFIKREKEKFTTL